MTNASQHSAQFLRKRKFLLVLPLLVLPFLFIIFVALGGGRGEVKEQSVPENKGFNMSLPEAHFSKKDTFMSKLGYYEKADEDSVKRLDRIRQDPYHARMGVRGAPPEDSTAGKLLKQLDQLKAVLRRPVMPAALPVMAGALPAPVDRVYGEARLPARSPDIGRLEKLMRAVKAADTSGGDPQMDKLNGMLDKILKIQHPAAGSPERKDTVAAPVSVILPVTSDNANADTGGFYAIDDPDPADSMAQNTLSAVVPEDQTLVAGATITLRLTQDASINGMIFPKDNLLYGQVSINGDRMLVSVSSVRYKEGIYPVSLQVFDMDGLAGIHIPGAITRDVAKSSADEGIGGLGLTALDPSLGAQAAAAGIAAAKTLASRKIRLVRVSVKAGYEVLLKNTKSKTH